MSESQAIRLMIEKFSGHSLPENDKALADWVAVSEERKRLYENTYQAWKHSPGKTVHPDANSNLEWQKLQMLIKADSEARPLPRITYLSIAAVVTIIFVSVVLYLTNTRSASTEWISNQNTAHRFLPDSSEVWLNAHSTLRFADDFGQGTRRVYLEGEGYFSVKPDTTVFIVVTNTGTVTVLGTEFNVKSDRTGAVVTVTKGMVNVQTSKDSRLLTYGNSVLMNSDDAIVPQTFQESFDWRGTPTTSRSTEELAPGRFLRIRKNESKNLLAETVVEGVVENHSLHAAYRDILIEASYVKPNGARASKRVKLKGVCYPGKELSFRIKLGDVFSKKKQVALELITAETAK